MNEATREGSADAHASDLDFLPPSTRPDSLGRVGHYEVLQMLGQGEFGIVFRAFDEQLRRVVAIKALAPQLAAATSARKRFLREGQSSAKVRHENIVQVYAVEEQPLPYLVMEFVAGETLQQRLDRIGLLEPAEVVRIGRQIAEGLAAAHASGLIHRDIKPANILIEAGPDQRVKITDFGLARAADDARLTQSGVISGTPMYMAPEQAQSEALDQRADLFSLGSVLYTMCSGQPPFRASSTLAVLKRVVEDTPRPIPEIVPDVPQWLCEIITQLHAKEPEGRIGTAREVADLLERGVTGMQHPGNAPSITQAAPALRRPRFRIGRWAATAALLLLGGLGVTEVTGVTNVRGTVIRLFSPNETRVVDVDDASSNVNIDGSAQEVSAPKKTAEQTPDTKEDGSPTSIKDPDRRAAEYVLSNRGKVQINEQDHEIEKAADLPRDAFRLTWVNMDGNLLGHTQARDAGLACFKYCKNLKYLNLDHTPLDNAGLSRLRGCKNLTYLNLGHTWVTDVGLANLKDWKALAHLNLDGNEEVTDAGLVHLKGCKNLTELFVRQTIVTAAGIDDLKKTLPKCKIEWNGGVVEPEQVEEVRKELMRRNPGFDGKLTSTIKNEVVTELAFSTEQVSDISPVRALTKLKNLNCAAGKLSDLSPLEGLKLATLDLEGTQVSDLSPLKGMPLTSLNLHTCPQIKDLTPLKGMPLTYLNIHDGPKVVDFSPLKGMPLTELWAAGNPVRDLSPLKGLPLTTLALPHCPEVQDLSPLKGLSLTVLHISDTKVQDLKPLKDMPLKTLEIDGSGVTDLTPLQGLPLEDIRLTPKNILKGQKGLRELKSLKTIGLSHSQAWPAAEFWDRYNKGEFQK